MTGGNGGSGLGMAEGLAAAGCDLVIWGGNPSKNAAAETALKAFGRRVLVQKVDVADENHVHKAFALPVVAMGRLAGCLPNAGAIPTRAPSHATSRPERRRLTPFFLACALFPPPAWHGGPLSRLAPVPHVS